jgi:ABC-type transport system involved in multi-copper enzyme maturation permease subunit
MLGPIFNREWLTLPRRPRHYLMRTLSLGGLWVLAFTVWQTTVGWDSPAGINELSRFGLLLFQVFSYVQLVLLLFFSALLAAGTISQEKDRRTFVLLLLTDLRNYEIVLGKLMGSLLEILLFLAGMIPIMFLIVLLGGVEPAQVLEASLVLAMTALAAGSLGGLIALWRDKTFQALALSVLILVLYLCLVHALSILPVLLPAIDEDVISSVQNCLEPFLALHEVVNPPENDGALSPALAYSLAMLGLSILLNGIGIWKLRVWNPSGEPIMQRDAAVKAAEELDRARAHAAPGRVREVWANPILFREIATRAYGKRPYLVKIAYFLVLALVCYYALKPGQSMARDGGWAAARGLTPVVIISLLLVSAQAVTSITSERDTGSLDLLLVTDLTPREFIFGKLLGILYNTKEFVLPPLILAGIYAWRGLLARPAPNHLEYGASMNLQSFLCLSISILVLLAFTIVLGVHVALRSDTTRTAITNTLGAVFFLSVGTLVCIYLILINGRFEYQWLSFLVFIFTGVAGLWWVLRGERPAFPSFTVASFLCPFAVFYTITKILIGKPGQVESADPYLPFLFITGSFGFAIVAMMVPLLSEFDVAMGRTSGRGD